MNRLVRKTWDSDFFGFPVGSLRVDDKIQAEELGELLAKAKEKFRLLYLMTDTKESVQLNEFQKNCSYIDERIIFEKPVNSIRIEKGYKIIEFNKNENIASLFKLAYESGKYSRFKMDHLFKKGQFEHLYRSMIENAMQQDYADNIFVKKDKKIEGFVTVKKVKDVLHIGLIGVDPEFQGTRVGSRLMSRIEIYAAEIDAKKVSVLTQKLNVDAIKFYKKQSFQEAREECIFHLWF